MSIIFSKEKDGTINVHAAGYVTKEPKVYDKVVLFGVCYGKSKYLDCKCWRNDIPGQIAECLEKHDVVTVDGVYESYENKDGDTKWQASVDAILVVAPPVAAAPSATEVPAGTQSQTAQTGGFTDLDGDDSDLPF